MKFNAIIDRAFWVLLCIYVLSLFTSMAGLEISSAVILILLLSQKITSPKTLKTFKVGPDFVLIGFFITVVIGWLLNRSDGAQAWTIIGASRWILTFYGLSFLIYKFKASTAWLKFYLASASVGAVYSFVTAWYGWDFIRSRPIAYQLSVSEVPNGETFARAVGFLGSPIQLGHTTAIVLPIVFALFAWCLVKQKKLQPWFTISFVVIAISLLLTYTRAAWIGGVAGCLVVAFLIHRKFAAVSLAALVALSVLAFSVSEQLQTRAKTFLHPDTTSGGQVRVALWKGSYHIFKEHPWFGVGLNRNEEIVSSYFEKYNITGGFAGHAHSNLLQFLAGTGIVGTLFYLAFVILMFVYTIQLWRKIPAEKTDHRSFMVGLIGAQVAFHIAGVTECNFKMMLTNHHFIFLLASVAALRQIYLVESTSRL